MNKIKKVILKLTPDFIYNKYRDKQYYKKYTNRFNKKVNIYKKKYSKLNINKPKKVSVVIPNYNYEMYLKERIDSVLLQTYPIHEIIILDDCSKDNSVKLIKEIIENNKDVKIKLIENKKNSGSVFSQWQKGFKSATGDYVWIAEADDSCDPRFLENVMKPFDDKEVVLSYCESMRIDKNNVILNTACRDWIFIVSDTKWNNNYVKSGVDEVKEALCLLNTILNVSAVVFKNNTKEIIDILEKAKAFKMSGDWYVYSTLLKNGKIAYTSKSLNYFRKHGNSTSSETSREKEIDEVLTIQEYIRDNFELNSEQMYRQQIRYENIIGLVSKDKQAIFKKRMVKKIKWLIPDPIEENNYLDKILEIANYLVNNKYVCDLYFDENESNIKELIKDKYGDNFLCGLYPKSFNNKEYDIKVTTNKRLKNSISFYTDPSLCLKEYDNMFMLNEKKMEKECVRFLKMIEKK